MCRSGVCSHVQGRSVKLGGRGEYAAMNRSGVVSNVEDWSTQPCGGVE